MVPLHPLSSQLSISKLPSNSTLESIQNALNFDHCKYYKNIQIQMIKIIFFIAK